LNYICWNEEDFKKNNYKCPYLQKNKCIIYPVRPIVCRLQGVIKQLPCKYNKKNILSERELLEIKNTFNILLDKHNWKNCFYSTKRYTVNNFN